jgi:hypothetical protein
MIKLHITEIIFFYILLSAIIILISWVFASYRKAGKTTAKDEEHIWRCSVCFHNYIDSRHEDMSACPMCGSYNKREKPAEAA